MEPVYSVRHTVYGEGTQLCPSWVTFRNRARLWPEIMVSVAPLPPLLDRELDKAQSGVEVEAPLNINAL